MSDTPDFIPDSQFVPDQATAQQQAAPTPITAPTMAPDFIPDHQFQPDSAKSNAPDFIPDSQFTSDEDKYGTTGQQALTVLEGAAQGIAGPLATAAELGLSKLGVPGISAQDIANRQAVNPWEHGLSEAAGLGAGFFIGTGEAGLVAKAGEAAVNAAKFGKIGSTVLKGFVESSLIQGGDEISRAMLGQGDPEAPVSSALAHMGAAGLFGGALGGAIGGVGAGLAKLDDAITSDGLNKWLRDFGARWDFHEKNPDMAAAVTQELRDYFGSTSAAAHDVYGATGLKSQAIAKLTQDMTPEQLTTHVDQVSKILDDASDALKSEKLFQDVVSDWQAKVSPIETSPSDVFSATDGLKRQMQEWGQYNKKFVSLSEQPFRNAAKDVGFALRNSLEDTDVWGKAGDLQAGINDAFKTFKPAQDDFVKTFTRKVLEEPEIDPGRVNTYINQLGKPNAEIKQGMLKNYMTAADNYRAEINDVYLKAGIENPMTVVPTPATSQTLGELSPGAQFADRLRNAHLPKLASMGAGAALGSLAGPLGAAGGVAIGAMTPYLEEAISRRISKYAMPALIRMLQSDSVGGVSNILQYANNINRGAQSINNGVGALFKVGGRQAIEAEVSERDREKVKKFIQDGELNRQIQAQQQKSSQPQMFAEGGEVQSMPTEPAKPVFQGDEALAKTLPDQATMLSAAKARISNYLSQLKPQQNPAKLTFDDNPDQREQERNYNKAVDIAIKPLSILNHIQEGTITPDHIRHLNAMYPELTSHLQKQVTDRIAQSQMDEEKPSYKVRQGLSMLMGTPLSGEMTPANIQAAQAVFAQQQAQQAQMGQPIKNKRGTSTLSKAAGQYQTATQAAEARQTNRG